MTHSKLEMDKVTGIDIGDYKKLLSENTFPKCGQSFQMWEIEKKLELLQLYYDIKIVDITMLI